MASVPPAVLDWENSAALLGRLVEALDFILRTSEHLEEWKSLVAAERRSLVSPKFLYCAVFGAVVAVHATLRIGGVNHQTIVQDVWDHAEL